MLPDNAAISGACDSKKQSLPGGREEFWRGSALIRVFDEGETADDTQPTWDVEIKLRNTSVKP